MNRPLREAGELRYGSDASQVTAQTFMGYIVGVGYP
jgi:hypothetical protein